MSLPTGWYLQHPPQYIPPSPPFPLERELARQENVAAPVVTLPEPPVKTSADYMKDIDQEVAALLVRKYQAACKEGRPAEARKIAKQALRHDPECFSNSR